MFFRVQYQKKRETHSSNLENQRRTSLPTRKRREGPFYHMSAGKGMLPWIVRNTSVRGRSEYNTWNKKVKELMDESKMRVGEEFDRKLSENS